MPLLPEGSVKLYSRMTTPIEVRKLSIWNLESGYCSESDPRSLYYMGYPDPTTEEYGQQYRSEYYTVKHDVAELRARRAAEHVQAKAIPTKAPPSTIVPYYDDDDYMPPPGVVFGEAVGSTMFSRRTNPQQEVARLRLRDALLDA